MDQQLSQLNQEIVKLTKFQTMVENSAASTPSPTSQAQDNGPSGGGEGGAREGAREGAASEETSSSLQVSLNKMAEYGSCEELERINRAERFDQREEVSSLTAKLREMEARWETLYTQHQEVVEERCELEEAENDSRLRAQK